MTDRYKPVGKLRTYSDERFAPVFIPEGALEPQRPRLPGIGGLSFAFQSDGTLGPAVLSEDHMPGGSCIEQTLYERVGCERTEAIELFNFICSESSLYTDRQRVCRQILPETSGNSQSLAAGECVRIARYAARLYSNEPVFTAADILSAALMLLEHDIATANENAQAGHERVC